jgi:hypothetical protein
MNVYIGSRWKRMMAPAALSCMALLVSGISGRAEEIRVAWTDPSKPGTVAIDLLNGQIKVEGYDGKDVLIDSADDGSERKQKQKQTRGNRAGLRRIGGGMGNVNVEEQNNVLRVSMSASSEAKISLRVPVNTSLKLSCVNCDDMIVNNVSGELELKNINGGIRAKNVSGSVVAHSLNDDVEVGLRGVTPGKAMSFSSMNGDIDVTMPATTKADFLIDTHNGDIYTDFEVALEANVDRQVNDNRNQGGSYKVKVNRNLKGKVNGGGPVIQFKNHNGDIMIRKGGA